MIYWDREGRAHFIKFPDSSACHVHLALAAASYCRCKVLFFSTDHMLEDLCVKVFFRGLKIRPSLSRGSVPPLLFLDCFFHCNVATCILNLWRLQVLIVLSRKPTCFKIEFKAKLLASFFVSVKIRVLLWAPQ